MTNWHFKFWDIIERLYWSPKYLGLRSISQKQWVRKEELVCVPARLVNPSGPLYTRERKITDLKSHLHGSEELLNDVFNLTFAIAPDALIYEALLAPLGFVDAGPFQSIGREVAARYGWAESDNVTQQDGFFVSAGTALCVELKLETASWPEQITKYAALLTFEELAHGGRAQLGLLFIVPQNALAKHWAKCGLEGPRIDRTWLTRASTRALPTRISELLAKHPEQVASVLDRLTLGVISWSDLYKALQRMHATLEPGRPGDQCLSRLITGCLSQLEAHRGTGI